MTKLLIVDDSPLMRRLLSAIFDEAGFETQVARNGEEAIEALASFAPNVITLDVQMPGMDGLTVLDRIMVLRPTPVVMLSALTEAGAAESIEALALGAVDVLAKPRGAVSLEIDTVAPELVERVRAAAGARVSRAARLSERVKLRTESAAVKTRRRPFPKVTGSPEEDGLVLVGTSTGGPRALEALLAPLPADFPWPIVIAQHMPASFTGALARRLDKLSALEIVEVTAPMPLQAGRAYIGRGDADLLVSRRGGKPTALPAPSSPDYHWHPSVDRLVDSALANFEPTRMAGVLMTGMGADGAAAMTRLHEGGGITIAEAQETAVVWGMPGALVEAGGAGRVAPLESIAAELIRAVCR